MQHTNCRNQFSAINFRIDCYLFIFGIDSLRNVLFAYLELISKNTILSRLISTSIKMFKTAESNYEFDDQESERYITGMILSN